MCQYFPRCVHMSWDFSVEVGVTVFYSQPKKKSNIFGVE
jgi:hypothetical protein